MKYSKQRERIYQAVLHNGGHLTAEDVFAMVRGDIPNISLGTVYRNLSVLVENGMLAKMELPGGVDHFEANTKRHYHVQCSVCGAIYDVELPLFGWLDDIIEQKTHIKADERYFLARGVCSDCAAAAKEK